ncbi:hypothetical protein Tco_0636054, partial [Tanacetum coccineum]
DCQVARAHVGVGKGFNEFFGIRGERKKRSEGTGKLWTVETGMGLVLWQERSYACSDSLLLTPLCCDDIHEVTPRVSALTGCDRLVSEPLVIEKYVSLIRKKFCWGTIFPIRLKRYSDPKEEPIEKEPLMELKEIG